MRLVQYLNENTDNFSSLEEFNETINIQCKDYIKLLRGKEPLVRGMHPGGRGDITSWMGIKSVRKNRIPSGMPQEEFKIFNKWLKKHKHNRRDSSVICTSDKKRASSFSTSIYYVFPIGNFSYSWIRSKDVNLVDKTTGWDYDYITNYFIEKIYSKEKGDKLLQSYIFTDEGFNDAYNQGYEFWFNCDMYCYMKVEKDLVWDGKGFTSKSGEFDEFIDEL